LLRKGSVIDSVFIVQKKLGGGTQGNVYHVKTLSANFDRALKLIDVQAEDREKLETIILTVKNEFSIIKSLKHKNIISVYDFGYDKKLDKYYYTMDYLEGLDLGKHVESYPEVSRFPDLTYQILDGLNYLHANGIIHFDIKPENIFVVNNNNKPLVKILDFGLSEIKKHDKQNQIIKGTLSYIAPEFFLDTAKISPKIDLYSLGITLIHVNKGSKSENFSKLEGSEIIRAVNLEYERNIELLNEFKDKKIKSFISRLVEKNPGTRISSAIEAVRSLNDIFNSDYKIPAIHHLESFLNNPKFILRDEIYKDLKAMHEMSAAENEGRTVFMTGITGSGKTKILDQLFLHLSLKLNKAVGIYLQDNTSEDFYIGKLLLRKIYNLYRNDINIEENHKKISSELDLIIRKGQDISYIFDDLIDFIFNCSGSGKVKLSLLLDDYENYDPVSVTFVNRLINLNKYEKKLFLIVSVSTDRMSGKIEQSYKMIEFDPDIKKIEIPLLTFEETEKAIEVLLGKIGSLPSDFSKKVYDFSVGNFGKLMEYFDEFFREGILNYISGILVFRSSEKFDQILKSGSGISLKRIFGGLDKNELSVLRLLCAAFNKLTFGEINRSVKISENNLRILINKLIGTGVVSGYNGLYKAIRSDIKDLVFEKSSPEELAMSYTDIAALNHSDKFSHYAGKLINIITSVRSRHNLTAIGDYVEKLIKYDSNDNLYYLLSNSIIFTADKDMRFRLEINYAYYLRNKLPEKAVGVLKDLDRLYKEDERDISNKISFIRLKFRMLDPEKYNYDAKEFVKKALPVMEDGMNTKDMYDEIFEFLKKLLRTGRYFEHGAYIISLLEHKFAKDKNISFEYPNMLNSIKFTYGVSEWKEEYENLLSDYIKLHIKNKLYNTNYFHHLKFIGTLTEKNLLKGDYSETLISGLDKAYRQKDMDNMFKVYSTLATYYFYKGRYEESLYWDQKRVDLKQKLRIELTIDDFSDIAVVKANLYYPIGEVITLIQETRRQAKEKNELFVYIENITNEFILLHRKGDFSSAKSAIRKAFLYFRTLAEGELLRNYGRVAKYFPEIFSKEESLSDAENLLNDGSVSKDTYNKILEMLEKFYRYNICYRWSTDMTDEILNGSMHIETPMMLLHYIKDHKKLPEKDQVLGTIEPRFLNPELTGDHLAFLVTKFMMTKDEKLIDPVFEFSRKLHILGYVMINVYTIIPFMEFALMTKVPKAKLKPFIEFYEEIRHYLYNNLDETQVGLFESTYFFRRGKKIIEYYEKLK